VLQAPPLPNNHNSQAIHFFCRGNPCGYPDFEWEMKNGRALTIETIGIMVMLRDIFGILFLAECPDAIPVFGRARQQELATIGEDLRHRIVREP